MNLHTNGQLVQRCYYRLVSVLNAIYDWPAVAEHTGEVVIHGSWWLIKWLWLLGEVKSVPNNVNESKSPIPPSSARVWHSGRFEHWLHMSSSMLLCERGKEEEACLAVIRYEPWMLLRCLSVRWLMIRCLKEESDWRVLSHALCQVISFEKWKVSEKEDEDGVFTYFDCAAGFLLRFQLRRKSCDENRAPNCSAWKL